MLLFITGGNQSEPDNITHHLRTTTHNILNNFTLQYEEVGVIKSIRIFRACI